jgi:hypothetical protein
MSTIWAFDLREGKTLETMPQHQASSACKREIKIAGVVGPFGSGSPANHSTGFDLPCGI